GLRAAAAHAVRGGFRRRQDRAGDHPQSRAEADRLAARDAEKGGRMTGERLLPWTLSFLRPYRGRVAVLTVLLLVEIGLGALQPWPFSIVIDYVLSGHDFPAWTPAAIVSLRAARPVALLVLVVAAGVLLNLLNQYITLQATQVQVDTGQRLVYDLRYTLFNHLQALGLHHHITTNTGDAVYRVDVDAYAVENLVMSGIFPLATSVTALVVMFGFMVR